MDIPDGRRKAAFIALAKEQMARSRRLWILGPASIARPVSSTSQTSMQGGRGLRALIESGDPGGRYPWHVLSETLLYATLVAPRIAHDLVAIDEAMRLGYNWGAGPFDLSNGGNATPRPRARRRLRGGAPRARCA